jgi:hypothetical protein
MDVFGHARSKLSPIRLAYRFFVWLDNLKWEVLWRVHPRHQYHIVRTGLRPGYYDQDERILHACMELLVEYVRSCDEGGYHTVHDEERRLFDWWLVERPANHTRLNEWVMCLFGDRDRQDTSMGTFKQYSAFEDKLRADDDAALHTLINIRGRLWT